MRESIHFYSSWNYQKTIGFLVVSGRIELIKFGDFPKLVDRFLVSSCKKIFFCNIIRHFAFFPLWLDLFKFVFISQVIWDRSKILMAFPASLMHLLRLSKLNCFLLTVWRWLPSPPHTLFYPPFFDISPYVEVIYFLAPLLPVLIMRKSRVCNGNWSLREFYV